MSKFLVTGGAGFIGSHIAEALLKQGDSVRIFDDLSTGKKENLEALPEGFEFHQGDLRNTDEVEKACKDVEIIFHEAAIPSVPRSIADPITSNDVNVGGTLKLLWAAKNSGVKRVVFASSSSVYGDSDVSPKHEKLPKNPLSPYASNKSTGEDYFRIFNNLYDIETVVLRYFNVFGPRQDPKSEYAAVVPRFITNLMNGRVSTIFGDGEQARDFTFVDNVVLGNLLAAKCPEAPGKIFNIACGGSLSVNTLYKEAALLAKSDLKPEYAPPRPGEVKNSMADITQAKEILGYKPKIDFKEGLKKTWDFFCH